MKLQSFHRIIHQSPKLNNSKETIHCKKFQRSLSQHYLLTWHRELLCNILRSKFPSLEKLNLQNATYHISFLSNWLAAEYDHTSCRSIAHNSLRNLILTISAKHSQTFGKCRGSCYDLNRAGLCGNRHLPR